MIAKPLLMMCVVFAFVNDRGCRSSADIARELAKRFPEPSAVEQAELDEILSKWEQNTAEFDRYRYQFRRWEYDPVFGPKDTFNTFSEGVICIVMPDQWTFRVDKTLKYQTPRQAGELPSYFVAGESGNEEWSCDGEWLSYADFERRQIVRTQLPPRPEPELCPEVPCPWMRPDTEPEPSLVFGEPLRWLGRINSQDLKRRYRMRLLPPTKDGDDHVIQAIPATPGILFINPVFTTIYLDHESCLPKAGILHWALTATRSEQHARTVFQFDQTDGRVADGEGFAVPKLDVRVGWTVQQKSWVASYANDSLGKKSKHRPD